MTKFTFGRNCPYCGNTEKKRIPRMLWMRLIPRTKYFRCKWCGYQFIPISERRSGLKDRRRSLPVLMMNDRRSGIVDRRRKIEV
jgi:hypothetical protein